MIQFITPSLTFSRQENANVQDPDRWHFSECDRSQQSPAFSSAGRDAKLWGEENIYNTTFGMICLRCPYKALFILESAAVLALAVKCASVLTQFPPVEGLAECGGSQLVGLALSECPSCVCRAQASSLPIFCTYRQVTHVDLHIMCPDISSHISHKYGAGRGGFNWPVVVMIGWTDVECDLTWWYGNKTNNFCQFINHKVK